MDRFKKEKALVLLSGGQDSVTCLAWATSLFADVTAISFDYGQKHANELAQGERVADLLIAGDRHVFSTDIFTQLGDSALVTGGDTTQPHAHKMGLPASYVPNRNAFMLTTAHALAQKLGINHIVMGVCETDYSGYPDCRTDFIHSMQEALNEGSESTIWIHTPLMFLDKAQTFHLAEELGALDLVLEDSRTCYNGDESTRAAWGYGCGECPACELREKGFDAFIEDDFEPFTLLDTIEG